MQITLWTVQDILKWAYLPASCVCSHWLFQCNIVFGITNFPSGFLVSSSLVSWCKKTSWLPHLTRNSYWPKNQHSITRSMLEVCNAKNKCRHTTYDNTAQKHTVVVTSDTLPRFLSLRVFFSVFSALTPDWCNCNEKKRRNNSCHLLLEMNLKI